MSRLWLIAQREYVSFLKTPGFWISLLIAPLVLGFTALGGPRALSSATPPPRLMVVDLTGADFTAALRTALGGSAPIAEVVGPAPEVAGAATPAAAGQALRSYLAARKPSAEMAVVLSGPPTAVRLDLWGGAITDPALASAIQGAVGERMRQARLSQAGVAPDVARSIDRMRPEVRRFSPGAANRQVSFRDQAPATVALSMAFVLWMAVVTGAGILLNSVIEEKSGRILEVLMSCASIPEILGGKILGVAGLTATVLAVWAAMGLAVLSRQSPSLIADVASALMARGLLVWFALFFIGGYLMYAALFAAIGSFCETSREAQTLLGPLMLVLSAPMLFLELAVQRPDAPLVAALSWVPLFTPFLMPTRLAGGLPLWQVGLGLLSMAASAVLVVWLCGRAFKAGALSGGKPDFKRLLWAAGRRLARRPA